MERESPLLTLATWFEEYPGKYFLYYELEQLKTILPALHGYYLVQIGAFESYELKSMSMIMNHIYTDTTVSASISLCAVESNLIELPFQSESVDVFILPHSLEYSKEPDKLLHEIYNILIPGGKLLIVGFNPYSLFGLTKLIKSAKYPPFCGKLYSKGHMKFWLQANGFSLDYQTTFCFRPFINNEKLLKKLSFLEPFGQFCFPYFGSVYLILAEKKMTSVPPLKMRAFPKKIPVRNGFPEPTLNKS